MIADAWTAWARGPLFWTALAFMILGLARHLGLTLWQAYRVRRAAGDPRIAVGQVARATAGWLLPVRRLGNRWPYSLTTLAFHAGVILVPLFLAGHVELWRRATGLSWPALPNAVATALTVTVLAGALAIVAQRALSRVTRSLGRVQDYALPLVIAIPFASGLLVMHPAWNPFGAGATLLVHVLAGDLVLVLVPLTKLSHMVLLPLTQLVSELAWRFPADAGARVAVALGKENEPI
jgi:nitrate reductase gamma subunit